MIKKIIICILAACMIFLAGCATTTKTNVDKKGNMLVYSEKDIQSMDGMFIQSGEYYYMFMPNGAYMDGDIGEWNTLNATRFIWYVGMDDNIPTINIKNGDYLILKSAAIDINSSIAFEKMEDMGYTIGNLFKSSEGTALWQFGGTCPNSNSSATLSGIKNIDDMYVVSINDTKIISSMLGPIGTFQGLEKDGVYKLSIYEGTYYREVYFKADSHLFVSSGAISTTDFEFTRDGYAIIHLPDTLASGYYYVAGQGLAKVVNE